MNIAGCVCSAGKAVTGERGELVCVRPFPSQPTHFWNDPDGAKYRKAYFEGFPGEIRTKDPKFKTKKCTMRAAVWSHFS